MDITVLKEVLSEETFAKVQEETSKVEGKLADLTVIDLNRPNMQPINNITKNLVYSGSKDDVKMTVINGKILYENGEFVNIDKEEIYFSAQEVTNRLKK